MDEKKSLELLKEIVGDLRSEELGINWENHKKHRKIQNCYKVTCDMMSIKLLIDFMDNPAIEEVYYHPSVSPPGAGVDPIAMRYRIYVIYK